MATRRMTSRDSPLIAVEDIKKVQEVIARENKQLVYAHFNLVVGVPINADIQKCTNHLENSFGRLGIHISKRAYNQLETFGERGPVFALGEEVAPAAERTNLVAGGHLRVVVCLSRSRRG